MEKVDALLEKYDNFKDAQIRSVYNTAEDAKLVTIVIQDDEGEDVESIKIEFKGVKESRILENSVLPMMDMMSGVSIVKEHDLYGFALGRGTAMLHVHNAPLFIIASEIEIQE